jgi:phosphate transport system substrate-binding protein
MLFTLLVYLFRRYRGHASIVFGLAAVRKRLSCKFGRSWLRYGVCGILFLSACSRVETPRVTPIPVLVRVGVDSATAPLVRAFAQSYQQRNPEWLFTFETGNAAVINGLTAEGKVDIAAVSLLPGEGAQKYWFTDLATDGVAIVVNAANPITDLSLPQIREIFAGFRNEWSYYGAQGSGSIQVVVREDGEGTRLLFEKQVMGDILVTSSAVVMPTPETAINFVALNPGAIAYIPSGKVTVVAQPGIRVLTLNGQSLSVEGLASGDYPLHRGTYVIARSEPIGKVRDFVLWMRSADAQQVMLRLGYAPIN